MIIINLSTSHLVCGIQITWSAFKIQIFKLVIQFRYGTITLYRIAYIKGGSSNDRVRRVYDVFIIK
jgi:hypothetical protein